jgi:hypothetical protein
MYELDVIRKAVETTEAQFKAKNLNQTQIETLNKTLVLSSYEYAKFQELKSQFQAMGLLSLDSAIWIYRKLSVYDKCTIPEKYILMQIFASMLKQRIKL